MGILGAYVKKLQTGRGTRVEASLLNAGLDLQTEPLTLYFTGRFEREKYSAATGTSPPGSTRRPTASTAAPTAGSPFR